MSGSKKVFTTLGSSNHVPEEREAFDYYNIKVLLQPFDRQKMINSGLKVATFVVGLTLLCVAITTLPIYADQLGWAIPEEYTEIFADLVIVGAVLMVSCKYIAEAFTKFRAILQVKGDTENE